MWREYVLSNEMNNENEDIEVEWTSYKSVKEVLITCMPLHYKASWVWGPELLSSLSKERKIHMKNKNCFKM